MYDEDDISLQMNFLKWSNPDPEFVRRVYELIVNHRDRVDDGGYEYLREQMVFKTKTDYRIEASVNILERWGCLEKSEDPFPFKAMRSPEDQDFSLEQPEKRFRWANKKLLDLVQFIKNKEECRLNQIYVYFGHEKEKPCGRCDACLDEA